MKTILLLTYDISPYRGSEASVSWNYVVNMSKENKLFVLYRNHKDEIDNYLKNNDLPNVVFYNNWKMNEQFGNIVFDIINYFSYKKWHKRAYKLTKEIIEKEQIDIVHYLNPIGFKVPGYLWKLDKPYIWGPITAVHNRPIPLFRALPFAEKIKALIRRIVHNALFRYKPNVRKAIKRTDIIGAATPKTQKMLLSIHKKNAFYLPENGIVKIENAIPIEKTDNQKLELVWIGRLDYFKALIILFDSLSQMEKELLEKIKLHIVGDGHLRLKLENAAKKLNINHCIVWHGQIPRGQVQEIIRCSHLHIITSLGEATTTVLWEAMEKGVPTMTLDHCGMSGVVCKKCGIKIPIISYEQVINDMAQNINKLIENLEEITRLSAGAIECAEKYTWDKRRAFFNQQYEMAINNFQKK